MATAAEEQRAVILRGEDNVAVAAIGRSQGYVIAFGGREVEVREPIALGHRWHSPRSQVGEPVESTGRSSGSPPS